MPVDTSTGSPRCHPHLHPLATAFVFVVALLSSMGLPGIASAAAGAPALDPQERAMCQQINSYRTARGLTPLKVSAKLTKAAKWMSQNMATNDYFDHSDSFGRDTFARIRSFGYRDVTMGENLASGLESAKATFNQWKNHAPHRAGMLRARFKVIGIGRAFRADSVYGWYWTTTFGATNDGAVAC